jgi:uncharacterized membrane protein YdjX (TVP38/TMEM64 family)
MQTPPPEDSAASQRIPRAWILGGLLLLIGVALFLLPIEDLLRAFLAWIERAGSWGPVLLAAAYIPATVLLIPGSLLTLGAGFAFGLVLGTIIVSVGSVLGSCAAFVLGRTLLRGWVEKQLDARPRLRAIDEAVARDGFKIALLIRLSPAFPYSLLGYVFGVTRISFRDHLFASWIGMLPGTILYVYLGCAGRHVADAAAGTAPAHGLGYWIVWIAGLLATLAGTVYITRVARRAIRSAAPEVTGNEEDAPVSGTDEETRA